MSHLHNVEKEQFKKLFQTLRPGARSDLMAVLDAFLEVDKHFTVDELHAGLAETRPDISRSQVAEGLEIFRQYGFAQKKSFRGQPDRYEHRHLGTHHDHLICLGCGQITEMIDPDLETHKRQAAKNLGFKPITHRFEVYGLCRNCQLRRAPTMPLDMARPGERVRFVRTMGGRTMAGRMNDLGLCLDTEVEVITNDGGPLVVACGGTRLALGRGMGHKIMVTPVQNGHNETTAAEADADRGED